MRGDAGGRKGLQTVQHVCELHIHACCSPASATQHPRVCCPGSAAKNDLTGDNSRCRVMVERSHHSGLLTLYVIFCLLHLARISTDAAIGVVSFHLNFLEPGRRELVLVGFQVVWALIGPCTCLSVVYLDNRHIATFNCRPAAG